MANRGLKAKRDAMLAALETELGNTCSWSRPPGGLFIWVRLPDGTDCARLESIAAERGVSFSQGSDFHVEGREGPYIRLAFGFARVADIHEGIARLARSIEDATRHAARAVPARSPVSRAP